MRHVLFVLVIVLLVPNAHAEITGGWFADPAGERNWGTYPSGRFSLYYVVWGDGEEIEAVEVGLRGYEQQLFTTGLEVLVDGAIAPTPTTGSTPAARTASLWPIRSSFPSGEPRPPAL